MCVFDTSALSELFGSYCRSRFPTLWELFDELVEDGSITSTREVAREIKQYSRGDLEEWTQENRNFFRLRLPQKLSSFAEYTKSIIFGKTSNSRRFRRVVLTRTLLSLPKLRLMMPWLSPSRQKSQMP